MSPRRSLALVSLAGFFYAIGSGAIWFVLPNFAKLSLGWSLTPIILLITLPSVVSLFLNPVFGSLSDSIGRKKVIYAGLAVSAPLGISLLVGSPSVLILVALLLGLASALALPATRALVMDICPQKKAGEYFGILLGVIMLGAASGPLISGFLLESSFTGGLPSAAILYTTATLLAIVPLMFLNETAKKQGKARITFTAFKEFKELKKVGLLVVFVTLILTLVDSIVWGYEPLFYGEEGFGAFFGGTLLFVFTAGLIVLQPFGGWLADRFGKERVMRVGLLLAGIFLAVFSLQSEEMFMILIALMVSLGLALAWPAVSGVITEISVDRRKGSIAGVWTLFMDVAYIAGPLLGLIAIGPLGGIKGVFLMMGIILIASLVPLELLTRRK